MHIRVSTEERDALKAVADRAGVSVSSFVRVASLHMARNPADRPDGLPADEFARVLATAAIRGEGQD